MVIRVEQLALGRLQVAGEPVQTEQPALLTLLGGLVAPQQLPASLGGCQRQTLLCFQEESEVLRVQALPVLGQLHQEEVDVRAGTELAIRLLELLQSHMGGQFLLAALDLLEAQTYLRETEQSHEMISSFNEWEDMSINEYVTATRHSFKVGGECN